MSNTQNPKTIDLTEGDKAERHGTLTIYCPVTQEPSIISWRSVNGQVNLDDPEVVAGVYIEQLLQIFEDAFWEGEKYKKGATTVNNSKNLRVIDRTEGDAHIVTETAIIHDLVGGKPSIISYDKDIESALEEMVGPMPEDHSHLPEEYAYFWNWCNDDKETIDGFEKALGIRIEYFEDFLRENSEEWTDNGIEVKEPNWRYPEDCISETPKK